MKPLSLGVYIDINLSAIDENKTEITIQKKEKSVRLINYMQSQRHNNVLN